MTEPLASIVLIVYNDAERIGRAIDSLCAQTLRDLEIIVVDDCSTDGTAEVISERMSQDSRIRSIRLDANSGGCSAPRNRGLAEARGAWVLFCDSDDEFEEHAAKTLVRAAVDADADMACGVVERVDVQSGKTKRWRADLHAPAVLQGIAERPELIADTVSVNKVYRRQWLIDQGNWFPEGVLYEDQLFTMRAYSEAMRIAVLEQTVYRWYVARIAEELSITQRRRELGNLRGRLEVNRLIDDYLVSAGRSDLLRVKQEKFLRHEMYLYLGATLEVDDETADQIIAELAEYVSTTDLSLAGAVRAPLRVAIYHAVLRDREGVRNAMKAVRWAASLAERVIARDGRELWGCEHLDAGPAVHGLESAWWLDITALHPSSAGLNDQRYCHELTSLEVRGDAVSTAGATADAYGCLGEVHSASVALVAGTRIAASMPARIERDTDGRWSWRAEGRFVDAEPHAVQAGDRGYVALVLELDGARNVSALRASRFTPSTLPSHAVRLTAGDFGAVTWRATAGTGVVSRAQRWIMRALAARIHHVARLLPSQPIACVMADGGTAWAGPARAAAEALIAHDPSVALVWVCARSTVDAPDGARSVRAGTLRHRWLAARARWWIHDGIPMVIGSGTAARNPIVRGRHTRVVVAALPTIQRTGDSVRDWPMMTAAQRRRSLPAPADLRVGAWHWWPTLDRAGARAVLGIAQDRPVVLWASVNAAVLPIEDVARTLDSSATLLVHGHGASVPATVRAWVRDVTPVGSDASVVAAADVVVTDAAPLAIVAAAMGLPVIVFAADPRDLLSRGPGLMLDWQTEPPGPVVTDASALVDAIQRAIDAPLAARGPGFVDLAACAGASDSLPDEIWSAS